METHLSIIDYLKKKYDIQNLEDYFTFFLLAIIITLFIYLSLSFPVFQTVLVIFILIIFLSYFINKYYEIKYNKQMDLIRDKFILIKNQIDEIIKNTKKN